MTNKLATIFITSLLVLAAAPGQADDIDIYYGSGGADEEISQPMVMFSLDWRPNLGSPACGGDECDFLIDGGYLDPDQADYTYFDVLRAVLRKVMEPLDGIRVGLMLNHDYKNNCAGQVIPGCSNGGYIALGFESFQEDDANGAKAAFHEFLDNIPTPQGVASHKYQGKELFFEFFRYLTGQEILNGHVGFLDYNGYAEEPSVDPEVDKGELQTEKICDTIKIKGEDQEFCALVSYYPDVEEYSCSIVDGGGAYSMACSVTAIDAGSDTDSADTNLDVDNPSISWDTDIEDGANYKSPLDTGGRCSKVFSVNLMFQVSQQEADSDDYIEASIADGGFGGSSYKEFPDVIEYLNDADLANDDEPYGAVDGIPGIQNVTSYFLIDERFINTTTRKYAQAGGTGEPLALSEDPEELVATLEDVFKQILSVSTTFVSASIPVNAFNRAEVIDNVYLALFRADGDAKPTWTGNVKKMKLSPTADGSGDRTLVDVYGDYAVAADGRIKFDALTFWTDASRLAPPDPDLNEVAGRDGRSTARGGSGQKIPGVTSDWVGFVNGDGGRTLYFDNGNDLDDLNADAETAGVLRDALGAATDDEALELLKYARGMDVNDEDGDSNDEDTRPWIMGDPLHSRPLPINYGAVNGYTEDNQAIYIAFGANDGFMRFIKNTEPGDSGAQSGEEVWAFMPQEVMGELETLKTNASGSGHPYLVDGSPTAYVEGRFIDRAIDGEEVYLYFGLRRGGKAYYAMDISDPEAPDLAWKITKGGDFAELGYTFSDPVAGELADGDTRKPIVMFGGGYDLNKDDRSGIGTNDTEGNALYVVDGRTGELIWKAVGSGTSSSKVFVHPDLVDSIPSQVTAMDSNGDLIVDRIYVGDTGGRIWRADISGSDTSAWTLTKLADVGRHYSSTTEDDRRFFHAPEIVQHIDSSGPFDAIVIGSGDRADPLGYRGYADNFVYMIKDANVKSGTGVNTSLDHADFGDVSNTCLQIGSSCMADLSDGWKLGLTVDGEAALAKPIALGGVIFFTTYLPPGASAEESCGPDEGSGRFYAVDLDNAQAVRNYDATTEALERFDDLDSDGIPSGAFFVPFSGEGDATGMVWKPDNRGEEVTFPTRMRTFWLESEDGTL